MNSILRSDRFAGGCSISGRPSEAWVHFPEVAASSRLTFPVATDFDWKMFHSFSEIEILDSFQQNYAFRFRLALFYFSCNLLSAARASFFDLPVFRFRTTPRWLRCRLSAPNLRAL